MFIVFYRRPSLLTLSNRLVLNLCICNFLLTVVVLPPNALAATSGQWPLTSGWCNWIAFITCTLFSTCVFTLLAISVDRYYAILRPLHYRMKVTGRRMSALLVSLWVVSGGIASPPLWSSPGAKYRAEWGLCTRDWGSSMTSDRAYAYLYLITCFLGPLVGMFACYVSIFRAAQHTSARARRNSADVGLVHGVAAMTGGMLLPTGLMSAAPARRLSTASLLHYSTSSGCQPHTTTATRRSSASGLARGLLMLHKDDQKAAATGLIVMSTFVACWMPVFALIAYQASAGGAGQPVPRYLGNAAAWTAFSGCAVNPFVYVFRSRTIVRECKCLLERWCWMSSSSVSSSRAAAAAAARGTSPGTYGKARTCSWPPSRGTTSEADQRPSPPSRGSLSSNGGVSRISSSAALITSVPAGKLSPLREYDSPPTVSPSIVEAV